MQQESFQTKEHFTTRHLALIAFCAVLIMLFSSFKNGFSFGKQKNLEQKKITYEMALNTVRGEGENSFIDSDANTERARIALLNPSLFEGQVAGTSTEIFNALNLPPVQTFLTESDLNAIKILTTDVSNTETITNYFLNISSIEIQNQIADLLYLTGGGEQVDADEIDLAVEILLTSLMNVKTPVVAQKYHKLNLFYYYILGEFAKTTGEEQKELGKQVFSLQSELNNLKAGLENKFLN